MATIERNGVRIAFDDEGAGDPPMLFIHGMACDRTHFRPQFDHFASSHRVVAYDQRGHGGSDKPLDLPYDCPSLAADAKWLCEELGLERPVVVGHSLGGGVATAFAAAYQDFAHAVVILDSGFEMPDSVRGELRGFYDALTPEVYDGVVRTFVRERLFDAGDDESLIESVEAVMAACPREVFLAMGEGVLAWDQKAAALQITVPTLFIASSRPFIDLGTLHAACPSWYLGRTIGAGHFHQLVVPDQVNAMIERFLEQIASGFPAAQPSVY